MADGTPRPATATTHPTGALRRVLRANGIFCALAGVTALAWGWSLGPWLGLPPLLLSVLGAVTAAYALLLFVATSRRAGPFLLEWCGWTTFFVDAIWVLLSWGVLLGGWWALTGAGRWVVAGVADVVALFTVLELLALSRRGP